MKIRTSQAAFTLMELLVVISIIAVLAALSVPAISGARQRSNTVKCFNNLRQIGTAMLSFAQDNQGTLPRSSHSAGANNEDEWSTALIPYLGGEANDSYWINRKFRCPNNPAKSEEAFSYGLNVFFELGPDDSYYGHPSTWRNTFTVPAPSRTILLAEVKSDESDGMTPDHFMCHEWSSASSAKNAVAHDRHSKKSNFLFADGHVETLSISNTFANKKQNYWNPSTAGL